MLEFIPQYFTKKAIRLYLILMVLVSILFINRILPILWMLFGLLAVVAFFHYSNQLSTKWQSYSSYLFEKKLFKYALMIRIGWAVFSYLFYYIMTGTPFNFDAADAMFYHDNAKWVASSIAQFDMSGYFEFWKGQYSDVGFPVFLGVQYWLTGESILITRIVKAVLGAATVVLTYKLTQRNFGEEVGRMAGVMLMLLPNSIFYTGLHLKEVEMVFLTMLFLERADDILRNAKINVRKIAVLLTVVVILFFFRTVLGAAALFALLTALVMTERRVSKVANRWFTTLWVIATIIYFLGGSIATEVEEIWEERTQNQEQSMEWRAQRIGGNQFAKYASSTIFAPAIFVIPLPTMVNVPSQRNQMMLHGGYYVKNILAFFVMFAFFHILKSRKIRENLLLSSFLLGYLMIIAFSAFAHSERFHQPALPLIVVFAAYGIRHVTNKEKKYFNYYQLLIGAAIIAWSWFKLAGRGEM